MTNEEKVLLIELIEKSIKTIKRLKFKYKGKASSFGEAMCLNHLEAQIDHELNEFLSIDKKSLLSKFEHKINLLNGILFKIKSL